MIKEAQGVEAGSVKEWNPGSLEPAWGKIKTLCPEHQLSLHFMNSVLISLLKSLVIFNHPQGVYM